MSTLATRQAQALPVITVPSDFETLKVSVDSAHSTVGDFDGDRLGN